MAFHDLIFPAQSCFHLKNVAPKHFGGPDSVHLLYHIFSVEIHVFLDSPATCEEKALRYYSSGLF